MGRRPAWLSGLLLVAACAEKVLAPGACPDYCPSTRIELLDSVVVGAIERDSSFRGYVPPHVAGRMQVAKGSATESRGVIRFLRFAEEVQFGQISVDTRPVVVIDSFRVNLDLEGRSAGNGDLELVIHRLPAYVDTTTTFADLDPFFDDSTEIAAIQVPDSVATEVISAILPGDAFPGLAADSLVAAIGIALRSSSQGFANLGTVDANFQNITVTRYVQVDSADGVLAERADTTIADMDTFVFPTPPAPGPTALAVGGTPSARALLRVTLPPRIVDSSNVVRATLILLPSEPTLGAPGDTLLIQAEAVAADFGPKSPIIPLPADSLPFASARVAVGTMDTVRIDITHIVVPWKGNPNLPRSFMLRAVPEGTALAELRFNSSESAVGSPLLQITYVPPIAIGR